MVVAAKPKRAEHGGRVLNKAQEELVYTLKLYGANGATVKELAARIGWSENRVRKMLERLEHRPRSLELPLVIPRKKVVNIRQWWPIQIYVVHPDWKRKKLDAWKTA